MPDYVIFIAVISFVVLIVVAMLVVERRRRRAIEALFAAQGDTVWIKPTDEVKATALEAVGSPAELKDGFGGVGWAAEVNSSGLPTWIVEHSYSRGSGKSRRTYNHTFAVARVPATWATTTVGRETMWTKLSGMFGTKDMQLDNEAFNKAFRVSTDDENFALVFLTPKLQEWMLTLPDNWNLRVTQGYIQVFYPKSADVKTLAALCRAPAEALALTTPELFGGEEA